MTPDRKELAELLRRLNKATLNVRNWVGSDDPRDFKALSQEKAAAKASIEAAFCCLESENERLKETALTEKDAQMLVLMMESTPTKFSPEFTVLWKRLRCISSTSEETS